MSAKRPIRKGETHEVALLKEFRRRVMDYQGDSYVVAPFGYYLLPKAVVLDAVDRRLAELEAA